MQDYDLEVGIDAASTLAPTSVAIYADTNLSGTYNAGDTLLVTGTNGLDAVAIDGTLTVFVVPTVPLTATNGQWANYYLRAITHDDDTVGGTLGALTTDDGGSADTPGAVDVVLDDVDGDTGAIDAAKDGAHMFYGVGEAGPGGPDKGFIVSGALLTVTKTSAVVSDPVNGAVNPKAIPGATVEYTITIANAAGAATATSVAIADTIDANTTASTSAYGAGLGVSVNFNGGGAVLDTSIDDGADTSTYSGEFALGVVGVGEDGTLSLAAGQNVVIKYQVTIN
ncbi:MAG: hypothetical protein A3J24_13190 [Deltaproteobacteria bacterium RIFCSPLOWO2_02_FULL_53_8]|nr:MAG: hypothetical protein A3J24_13190 [Deltaproteobacteria bacterium RIFCSPLOWO2_02_FULL_53_8]